MATSDQASRLAKIQAIGTIEEQCLDGTAEALMRFITENFAVDTGQNTQPVVVGNVAPSADQRGAVWFRLDDNRNFLGLYVYNGNKRKWLAVTPLPTQEARIYWKFDPTRNLADLPDGYAIDDDVLLSRDQKKDANGNIVYAWIRPLSAKY